MSFRLLNVNGQIGETNPSWVQRRQQFVEHHRGTVFYTFGLRTIGVSFKGYGDTLALT